LGVLPILDSDEEAITKAAASQTTAANDKATPPPVPASGSDRSYHVRQQSPQQSSSPRKKRSSRDSKRPKHKREVGVDEYRKQVEKHNNNTGSSSEDFSDDDDLKDPEEKFRRNYARYVGKKYIRPRDRSRDKDQRHCSVDKTPVNAKDGDVKSSDAKDRDARKHHRSKTQRKMEGPHQYITPEEAVEAHALIKRKDPKVNVRGWLTEADFHSLHSRRWVNDSIINTYLDLVFCRVRDENQNGGRNVMFFNSFFWDKLVKFEDAKSRDETNYTYSYEEVKGWTSRRKIDIFAKDILVMPLNRQSIHWAIIAINMVDKTYSYNCSLGLGPPDHLDKCINQYLKDEYRNKKKAELTDTWTRTEGGKAPDQRNGFDCGVFAVRMAECLLAGEEFNFSQDDMFEWRLLMALELYRGQLRPRSEFPCNRAKVPPPQPPVSPSSSERKNTTLLAKFKNEFREAEPAAACKSVRTQT